jgi:polyisoprenoid-binding protein YceI
MTTATQIPGFLAGTWDIDPVHSDVSFSVRHMMVSKVRGRFATFSGEITTGKDITDSTVVATIDATSSDTNNAQRDGHIRSADFFDVENHPTWTFTSTGVREDDGDLYLDGNLTIKGVTRPVSLELEPGGFGPDAYGGTRSGFTATTSINRNDFGVDISMPLDGGGVVVGDKVQVTLEIEAVLRTA